jgi:hypothetical protein
MKVLIPAKAEIYFFKQLQFPWTPEPATDPIRGSPEGGLLTRPSKFGWGFEDLLYVREIMPGLINSVLESGGPPGSSIFVLK